MSETMHYLDLVRQRPLIWGLFFAYLAATSYLAWLGHRKTTDIRSFAVGAGTMHPAVVGITLAASIASTATFVINPGFVYVHGLSALLHLGGAAGLGVITGLVVMSGGFRRIGVKVRAITLPQWLGQRYGSRALAVFFAAVNLMSLTFVVLILGGLSIVMQKTLGLSNTESLVLVVGFVFSYIFVGGTYAHAYTNTLQGILMAIVSVVIVASGAHLFRDGVGAFAEALGRQDPSLVAAVNEHSPLFNSFFSVFVAGFVVGFALVCQPHIMTKALYVKSDRDVRRYLAVTIAVSLVFTALLLVGLYARVMDLPAAALVDPATGRFSQDRVMAAYLASTFSPGWLAVITVALLAAGMSTLDGILVALSSIAANDLFLGLTENNLLARCSPERRARIAHRASQVILVILGAASFAIALDPPRLLGIFGQVGVYAIVAASTVPILLGILAPHAGLRAAFASALVGLTGHLGLYAWARWAASHGFPAGGAHLGLLNPAVTATCGLLASAAVGGFAALLASRAPAERAPRLTATAVGD